MEITNKLPFDLKVVVHKELDPIKSFFDQKFKLHESFYQKFNGAGRFSRWSNKITLEIIYNFVKNGTKENKDALIDHIEQIIMKHNHLNRSSRIPNLLTVCIGLVYLGDLVSRQLALDKIEYLIDPLNEELLESEIDKYSKTISLIKKYLNDPKYFERYYQNILF